MHQLQLAKRENDLHACKDPDLWDPQRRVAADGCSSSTPNNAVTRHSMIMMHWLLAATLGAFASATAAAQVRLCVQLKCSCRLCDQHRLCFRQSALTAASCRDNALTGQLVATA